MKIEEQFATESGHYYFPDGRPCYEVPKKDGKGLRPTTIRDVRSMGLLPSVTQIIKEAAKPGLDVWKQQQVLLAALTLPRLANEQDEAFCARVMQDSKEQARKAAERGTALHGAIEKAIRAKSFGDDEWTPHVKAVHAKLAEVEIDLFAGNAERSFACVEHGYAGKIDYSHPIAIIDIKNKPKIEAGKKMAYDEHSMQLSAYKRGLKYTDARLLNVFVGCEDAQAELHEWTKEDEERGWAMFISLLGYWKARNKL